MEAQQGEVKRKYLCREGGKWHVRDFLVFKESEDRTFVFISAIDPNTVVWTQLFDGGLLLCPFLKWPCGTAQCTLDNNTIRLFFFFHNTFILITSCCRLSIIFSFNLFPLYSVFLNAVTDGFPWIKCFFGRATSSDVLHVCLAVLQSPTAQPCGWWCLWCACQWWLSPSSSLSSSAPWDTTAACRAPRVRDGAAPACQSPHFHCSLHHIITSLSFCQLGLGSGGCGRGRGVSADFVEGDCSSYAMCPTSFFDCSKKK